MSIPRRYEVAPYDYPHFSSLVVARRREVRPGKACDRDHSWRTPAVVLVQYVEEADGAKHSQGG